MKEVGFKIFKMAVTFMVGGVFCGSVVTIINQKDKNKLKQEVRRAQNMNEKCFKIIDILQKELDKKAMGLEQLRARKMNERQDRAGFASQETAGENPC